MAIPEAKKTPTLLSDVQYSGAVAVVVNGFDREIVRCFDETVSLNIIDRFTSLYYGVDLFSFFTAQNLKAVTEDFFTDDLLRRFLLNYVDRVSIDIASMELTYDDVFIGTIVEAVTRNKPYAENSHSLINKEVLSSLYINKEVLTSILKDNFWLAVLYLLLINFHQTSVYKGVTGK